MLLEMKVAPQKITDIFTDIVIPFLLQRLLHFHGDSLIQCNIDGVHKLYEKCMGLL